MIPLVITPGSPGKFLMAAFVRPYAQKVTAEVYPVQPIVMASAGHDMPVKSQAYRWSTVGKID